MTPKEKAMEYEGNVGDRGNAFKYARCENKPKSSSHDIINTCKCEIEKRIDIALKAQAEEIFMKINKFLKMDLEGDIKKIKKKYGVDD
jgi:hypothetical protein